MFHMIFVSLFLNLKVTCFTTFAALVSFASTEVDFFLPELTSILLFQGHSFQFQITGYL